MKRNNIISRINEGQGLNDQVKQITSELKEHYLQFLDWLFLDIPFNSTPSKVKKSGNVQINSKYDKLNSSKNFQTIEPNNLSSFHYDFKHKYNSDRKNADFRSGLDFKNVAIVTLYHPDTKDIYNPTDKEKYNSYEVPVIFSLYGNIQEPKNKQKIIDLDGKTSGFYLLQDTIIYVKLSLTLFYNLYEKLLREDFGEHMAEVYLSKRSSIINDVMSTLSHELTHALRSMVIPNVKNEYVNNYVHVPSSTSTSFGYDTKVSEREYHFVQSIRFALNAFQEEEIAVRVAGAFYSPKKARSDKEVYMDAMRGFSSIRNLIKGFNGEIQTPKNNEHIQILCKIIILAVESMRGALTKQHPLYIEEVKLLRVVVTKLTSLHNARGYTHHTPVVDSENFLLEISMLLDEFKDDITPQEIKTFKEMAKILEKVVINLEKTLTKKYNDYIKRTSKNLGKYMVRDTN